MAALQGAVGAQGPNYSGVSATAVTSYTQSKYPILSRYHVGAHPLAKESSLGKLEPLPETKAAFVKALTREMTSDGAGTLDPHTVKKYQDKMVLEGLGENVDLMYAREFQRWLRGVSVFNAPQLTPWGFKNMFHVPGVVEYLRELIHMRFDYQRSLMHLYMQPPRTLLDLELYYKYIVLQFGLVIPRGDGVLPDPSGMPSPGDPRSFMSVSGMLSFLDDYQLTSFRERDVPLMSEDTVDKADRLVEDLMAMQDVHLGAGPDPIMPNGAPVQSGTSTPQPIQPNVTKALQLQLQRQHQRLIATLAQMSAKNTQDIEASSADARVRHGQHLQTLQIVDQNATARQAEIVAQIQELIDKPTTGGGKQSTEQIEALRKDLAAAKAAAAAETARLEKEYQARESANRLNEATEKTERTKTEEKMKRKLERLRNANQAFSFNEQQLHEMLRNEAARAQQAHDLAMAATKGASAEQVRLLNENLKLQTDQLHRDFEAAKGQLSKAAQDQFAARDAEIKRLSDELAKAMAEANAAGVDTAQGELPRAMMSEYLSLLNEQLRQQRGEIDASMPAPGDGEAGKKKKTDLMDLTVPEVDIPAGAQQFIDEFGREYVKLEDATVTRTITLPKREPKVEPKAEAGGEPLTVPDRFVAYARAKNLTENEINMFNGDFFLPATPDDQYMALRWINTQSLEDPELHNYKVELATNLAGAAVAQAIGNVSQYAMEDTHARDSALWLLTEAVYALDDRYFHQAEAESRQYLWGAINNMRRFLLEWYGLPEAAPFPVDKYTDDLPLDANGNVDRDRIFDAMDESVVIAGSYYWAREIIEDEASAREQSNVQFIADTLQYASANAAIDVDVYPALSMDVDASTDDNTVFVLSTGARRRAPVIDLTGATALFPPSTANADERNLLHTMVGGAIKQEVGRYNPGRENALDADPQVSLANVQTEHMVDVDSTYMTAVMQTMKNAMDSSSSTGGNIDPITVLSFTVQHITRQMHQHEAHALPLMDHLEQYNQVPTEDQAAWLRRFGSVLAAAQAANGIALGTVSGYIHDLRQNNDTNPFYRFDENVMEATGRVLDTATANVDAVRKMLTRVKQHLLRRHLDNGLDQRRYGPNDHLQAALVVMSPSAPAAVEQLIDPVIERAIPPEDRPLVTPETLEQFRKDVVTLSTNTGNKMARYSEKILTADDAGQLGANMGKIAKAVATGLPTPPPGAVIDMLAMIQKTPAKDDVRNAALSEVAQLERFTKRVNLGHLATLRTALLDLESKRAVSIRPDVLENALVGVKRTMEATTTKGSMVRSSFDDALTRLREIYSAR